MAPPSGLDLNDARLIPLTARHDHGGIFPILANKAYYQVANFEWGKWWAWQGLNLRPLRCWRRSPT